MKGYNTSEPTKAQKRNYYLVILAMVSVMVTTSTIYMVLPLFFKQNGMSTTNVGALISIGSFAGIASSIIAGKYSDSHGRKPILLAGVSLYAVVFFLFAFAGKDYNTFLVLRFIEGFAFYMTPVAITTMAADTFPKHQRGKAMALYTMSSGIGQFVGPLAAGQFLKTADFTTYFYFCGGFVAIGALIVLFLVKETRPDYVIDHHEKTKGDALTASGIMANIKSLGKVVAIFFVAVLIYRTGNTMVNPFFSLYLEEELHLDVSQSSYFFAIRALMTLVFAPIAGYLLDKQGRKPTFMVGMVLLVATMLGYRAVSTYNQVLIIRALESISNAVLMTTTRTFVADLMRPEIRGFGMGLYMTIVDESSTMGALLGGWIAEVYSFGTIFLIGAVTAAVCAVITWLWVPEPPRHEIPTEKVEQVAH